MQAHPPLTRGAGAAPTAAPGRRVVDAPMRMFHWLFALSFLGAYLSADGERWRALHVNLGYTLAGLLVFRLLYGMFGPRQAGLGALWRKLAGLPAWLRSLGTAWRQRSLYGVNGRQGQNLLMALAVFGLLALVLPLTLSGYALFHEWGGEWLEELHEVVGNAFLAVVLGHVALIAGLSVWRRSNQAAPMLSGRLPGAGPDLVKNNRGWLAALLLLVVLAWWTWDWQQSPQGLIPSAAFSRSAMEQSEHDGD
jgi:cytochrome b